MAAAGAVSRRTCGRLTPPNTAEIWRPSAQPSQPHPGMMSARNVQIILRGSSPCGPARAGRQAVSAGPGGRPTTTRGPAGRPRRRPQAPRPTRRVCATGGGSDKAPREDPMDSHEESDHEASFEASPANSPSPSAAPALAASPADIQDIKKLVEVAMLAAMMGLAYFLAAIVKLEGYLGYFLPMPVVLASMRWGSSTGWRTVFATCCLVAVLLGPVRMLGYLCNHGVLAGTLGVTWATGLPWAASVPICAVVRTAGMLAHLAVTSWTVNENLFQLLLSNVYAFLDQILSVAGSSMVPTQGAIISVCGVLLLANALVYMTLMNILYAVILRNMGYKGIRIPPRIERALYPNSAAM